MVKRKSSVPQRLCEERRSQLTWDLGENDKPLIGPINGENSRSAEVNLQSEKDTAKDRQSNKRQRRKSQQGDDITDEYLKSIIEDCSFYIPLKKQPDLNKNERVFQLGKLFLKVTLQEVQKFPIDGEYWLYVSELQDRSLLYNECRTGVQYFLMNGTLDFQLYSGLSHRSFILMFEDFIEDDHQLCINVLFRESFCRGPSAHWEIKQRSTSQDFQAVMSYFFKIDTPALFDGVGEVRKHDIDGLYKFIKEYHENSPSNELPFTQHSSLVPRLRPYQIQAVKWMLCRESVTENENDTLHCLYMHLELPDGQPLYYNKYAGYITLEKPTSIPLPTGGILADEMGLGKTVEVLACLLANQRPASDFKTVENNENSNGIKEENDSEPNVKIELNKLTLDGSHANVKPETVNLTEENISTSNENVSTESNVKEQPKVDCVDNECFNIMSEECSEVQEVDYSMECDVAANVMVSCNDGDSNSTNSVKMVDNSDSKNRVIESGCNSLIDSGNNSSNTNLSVNNSVNRSSDNNVEKSPKDDSGYHNSFGSAIMYDLENYRFSDEDESEEDDPNDEDWQTCIKFERLKDSGQRKKYKVRSVRGKKDAFKSVDTKDTFKIHKRTRAKQKTVQKIDLIEATIEEVIAKFCGGKSSSRNRRTKIKEVSSWRAASQIWYQEMLSAVSLRKPPNRREIVKGTILECVCGSEESNNKYRVCCSGCSRWQHAECVGYKREAGKKDDSSYSCPQCWQSKEPIVSGATLIVSPASISNQWVTEIQRHIEEDNFQILVYKGVHKDGFLQPYDIAKNQIVITTYETLRKELDYADLNTTDGHRLRHVKRFLAAPSPLPCINWWRLCLDEAQMVECTGNLFGLVQFLGIDPYCDIRWWQDLVYGPYCHGIYRPLHELMAGIMWRTAKKDVLQQINIPEQTEEVEWLHFSPVEEHFYRRQHSECSQDFIDKLSKMRSLDITLDSLDRQTINKILGPLLRLRQACSHPQAVRGQFLTATKATMSMEELLESLIKKTQNESEEALRQHIASLNADVLDGRYKGVAPTLRDDKLREEALILEQKYMQKCDSQVAAAQETLANLSMTVNELENGFSIGRDNWWGELLAWLILQGEETELLSKIRDDLLENKVPGQESLINRVSNIRGLEYEIGKWSDAVEKAKKKAVTELRQLEVTARQDLVNEAVDCHLRISNANNKNKKKCKLCICETHLKNYESLVFAVSKKQTEHSMIGNVLLLGQLNQGTWKPCEMERVLRVLVAFVRGKRSNRDCLEDGNQHLKLLDAIKKEFRHLRLVWTQLRDQVSAQDELDMAKLKLRIRYPDEPMPQNNKKQRNPLQQLSSNIGNVAETIHIIEWHQVSSHETRLESERIISRGDLRRKTGQLLYLENLRKSQGLDSNPDPCPVCQTNLGDKCGHCYCMECVRYMVDQSRGIRKVNVKCPICRDTTPEDGISYVNLSSKTYEPKEDGTAITVRGSHSTKVEAVVHRLLALRAAEPDVKALVFSTWEKVLDVLAQALTENGVSFSRLQPGLKHQQILQHFKDNNSHVTALLLPVRWGAKGLNLIEATHVLLIEPILNPADELQAVGRVHRIGQTR
ncbi:hypothetical protein C0J52_06590 [Blattella germanica]|nr:hypothetical protein C0J52_06590 [Blattella germanica]